jgi:hypothetical protein
MVSTIYRLKVIQRYNCSGWLLEFDGISKVSAGLLASLGSV